MIVDLLHRSSNRKSELLLGLSCENPRAVFMQVAIERDHLGHEYAEAGGLGIEVEADDRKKAPDL